MPRHCGEPTGPAFGAPDDKLRDTHQLHFMKTMGFAGLNLSYVYGGQVGIVARMERSVIRDRCRVNPGYRFAHPGYACWTRNSPSGKSRRCSPDGAKRNPGPVSRESRISLRSIRATMFRLVLHRRRMG